MEQRRPGRSCWRRGCSLHEPSRDADRYWLCGAVRGLFKLAVAECQPYRTLGDFLHAAQQWVNFYNTTRPHESLDYRSLEQLAKEQQLNSIPTIALF